MTWSRLVGLGKCPGVRSIGIGDILRRLFAKVLLIVVGKEATRACGTDQLCCRLEVGIEGGIHHIRSMCDEHESDKEDWGLLLIGAKNAFNEGNRKIMFWVVRHKWPSSARFMFNLYRHQSVLVVRCESKKKTIFLYSSEGSTQGCPLAMLGYGILLLPIIITLKTEIPEVKSPWYADDGAAAGTLKNINLFFKRLCEIGPDYGYFPEESKSILIVRSKDREKAELFMKEQNCFFNIKNGYRYLSSFIGGESWRQSEWFQKLMSRLRQ